MVQSMLAAVCVLALVAQEGPVSAPTTAGAAPSVEAVLSRFTMPSSGYWAVESEHQEFAPTREVWERSVAHMRSNARARVAETPWEETWIRERVYITEPTWVPAVAQRWKQPPLHVLRSESLARSGECSQLCSRERFDGAQPWSVTTTRIANSAELVWWTGEPDQPRRIQRERLRLERGRYAGATYAVAGFLDNAAASLRFARDNEGAIAGESTLSWSLDLTRPRNLAVLAEYDLPGGLGEIPGGRLHGEHQQAAGGASLSLEWSDPSHAKVARHFGRWNERDELVFVEGELYAPGTDFVTTRWIVRLARTRAEVGADECRWRPQAGDYVVDLRFDGVLSYSVGAEGLPDDASLAARSRKNALRRAATAPPVRATVECRGGAAHGGGSHALGLGAVDLAAREVGAVVPIELELVNRGSEALGLGAVAADCGCLEPTLDDRMIPAHGSVVLRVRQSIDRVGPRVSNLRIPILAGGSGEIVVTINFIGAPSSGTAR